jgi:hypothetical protein
MDVDQNKFGGLIIITALIHGKSLGATDLLYFINVSTIMNKNQ